MLAFRNRLCKYHFCSDILSKAKRNQPKKKSTQVTCNKDFVAKTEQSKLAQSLKV